MMIEGAGFTISPHMNITPSFGDDLTDGKPTQVSQTLWLFKFQTSTHQDCGPSTSEHQDDSCCFSRSFERKLH